MSYHLNSFQNSGEELTQLLHNHPNLSLPLLPLTPNSYLLPLNNNFQSIYHKLQYYSKLQVQVATNQQYYPKQLTVL